MPPDVAVEQIFAPLHAMTVFMGFQDPLDQRHYLPVCNGPADTLQQDFMVDAREIPAQVALEDVGEKTGKFRAAPHAGMSALAFPAGIAVLYFPCIALRAAAITFSSAQTCGWRLL